jgi:hypothetical protein
MMEPILVYGATGFTGRSVVQQLLRAKPFIPFVCAGRDASALARLEDDLVREDPEIARARRSGAQSLPLRWRVASVDDPVSVDNALRGVRVVVNAAGPFEATARRLARACRRAKSAYLDTSGELDDFNSLQSLAEISNPDGIRGVPVLCGIGFTPVFATEMARLLKTSFETAGFEPKVARVGMAMPTRSSRGSARSALKAAAEAKVYRNGTFAVVPTGSMERSFPVSGHRMNSATCGILTLAELHQIGMGLGLHDVECYFEMHALTRTVMAGAGLLHGLDRFFPWKKPLDRAMGLLPEVFDMRIDPHLEDAPKLVCVEMEDAFQRRATFVIDGGDHYGSTAVLAGALARDLVELWDGGKWTDVCDDSRRLVGWVALERGAKKDVLGRLPETSWYLKARPRYHLTATDRKLAAALESVVKESGLFAGSVPADALRSATAAT